MTDYMIGTIGLLMVAQFVNDYVSLDALQNLAAVLPF